LGVLTGMGEKFKYWKIERREGVTFLSFRRWEGVDVFYSTRIGGISSPPFDSLNLHFGRGDKEENVLENRNRLYGVLGIRESSLVFTKQTHSDTIRIVYDTGRMEKGDGLLSNREGVFLAIFTADCPALFFCAPEEKVIGIVHSGWRGTNKNIAAIAVRSIGEVFGVKSHTLEVLLGPSLGPCCYRVGEEFLENFNKRYFKRVHSDLYFDIWSAIKDQLREAGVKKVYIPELCSSCEEDYFFSYRRSGERVGENLGIIGIRHTHP
jgi:YfiH family protein